MSLLQDGASSAGFGDIDSLFQIQVRPGVIPGDHNRIAFKTGSLAFTNGVVVANIRNPAASLYALTMLRARYKTMAIAAPSATGLELALSAFKVTGWSVLGTTNRTALTFTSNSNKIRSSMGAVSLNVGVANAVGGITGDTGVQDDNAFAMSDGSPQNHAVTAVAAPGAAQQPDQPVDLLYSPVAFGEYPMILAQNEGVRIVLNVTTAAAGIVVVEFGGVQCAAFPRGS